MNARSQEFDIITSSFENSNIQNVLSFNNDIQNLITYVNSNDIKIVNLHYTLFELSLLKRRTNAKIVMTNHNTYKWFDDITRNSFNEFNNTDYFINVSEQVKEFNVNVLKNDIEKSIVINNGTDITNTHKLNNKIIEEFKGKKFILVLDQFCQIKVVKLVKAFKIFYDNTNNKAILILLGRVSSIDYADKIKNFRIVTK